MTKGKSGRAAIFAALGILCFAPPAGSHSGATGVVAERMEEMKAIAAAMKGIAGMQKDVAAFDGKAAHDAAAEIARRAARLPKLFPKGSSMHPSEARPVIWTNWQDFADRLSAMERQAKKLARTAAGAGGAGEIDADFKALAASCKGCHEHYRQKK